MEVSDQYTVLVYFHENKGNLLGNVQNKIYETLVYSHAIDCMLYKRADHKTLPYHFV
jgi:sRNA-binding regulator protein Hfq